MKSRDVKNKSQPRPTYVDDLWERIGKKLRNNGVRPKDIEPAIRDVRASKMRDANG